MCGWGLKNPQHGPLFFKYFRQFKEKRRQALLWLVLGCDRPAHVAESGPLAWLQVLQNSGSRMFMLSVKTLSARDRHWLNPRKRNYRERGNIKAHVSVHWRAQCHAKWQGWQRVSAASENQIQAARRNATHLRVTFTRATRPLVRVS